MGLGAAGAWESGGDADRAGERGGEAEEGGVQGVSCVRVLFQLSLAMRGVRPGAGGLLSRDGGRSAACSAADGEGAGVLGQLRVVSAFLCGGDMFQVGRAPHVRGSSGGGAGGRGKGVGSTVEGEGAL